MAEAAAENAHRAVAVYVAMQRRFLVQDGLGLYRLTFPWTGGNRYSYVWEFSRALVGTLALAGIPSSLIGGTDMASAVHDRFAGMAQYWNARVNPPAYDAYVVSEGGGDRYHDDNVWIALAFIQAYRMGLTRSLDRARQLFAFGLSGWNTNSGDPHPGGIFWVSQGTGYGLTNHDRGTGATAGNAELGLHLHLLTGSATDSADARTAGSMADWVHTCLESTASDGGLYWNAVRLDGSIDTNLWSYNQGVMIGADLLRFQVTRDSAHLAQAAATATNALRTYGDFQGQPPAFNAMLFQNLLMLQPYASSALQARIVQCIQTYADWAWANPSARDPHTNLFYFDDAGRPVRETGQPAQLRDQGAMTQVYALLAWSSDDYGKLT